MEYTDTMMSWILSRKNRKINGLYQLSDACCRDSKAELLYASYSWDCSVSALAGVSEIRGFTRANHSPSINYEPRVPSYFSPCLGSSLF
jgi:hypothetical protein